MFVKTYENLSSSALLVVKVGENSVFATYNSNPDKEYEFNCENTDSFNISLSETLKNEESVGKLFHQSIKEGKLVAVTRK